MMNLFGVLANILGIGGDYIKSNQELKLVKVEGEIARVKAITARDTARIAADVQYAGEYDVEALRQQQFSWKDEYLLMVNTAPFIAGFIPAVQDYVLIGWETLAKAPSWYVASYVGIVAATFGLRWLFGKNKNQE